jgi:hypothetical protein
MAVLTRRWARALYISTYVGLIVGIGLSLLVTGYDLLQQTLALAQGGGQYFYIFILVGAYVATVLLPCHALESTDTYSFVRDCLLVSWRWQGCILCGKHYRIFPNDTCPSRKSMFLMFVLLAV